MRVLPLLLLFAPVIASGAEHLAKDATSQSADNDSFLVRSYAGGPRAEEVLTSCQTFREQLEQVWLGEGSRAPWRPRCEVVVHGSRDSYRNAVGPGAGSTSGSSVVRLHEGRVVMRRVDLLVDAQGRLPALPHELTHIVLGERFAGRRPPRWIDEGAAMLADTAEKRSLHHRDCCQALRSGGSLRLGELLQLERLTSYDQAAAFYGQSLSLVSYLVEQKSPADFIAFADLAMQRGYDNALRSVYQIDGVAQLERQWKAHAEGPTASAPPAAPMRFVSFHPQRDTNRAQ